MSNTVVKMLSVEWTNYERISRTATIRVQAPLAKAFPLFGPVLEKEWAWGWEPEVLYSASPWIEEKMIFRTRGVDGPFIWVVGRYEPQQHLVEYIVHTDTRIWFINVSCRADGDATLATVTYTYTGLTEDGRKLNREALDGMFRHDLKDWEEAIAHYLTTGAVLRPENASFN